MNFSELEKIMLSRGIDTLANIARKLDTTPQAVSNWKARDQVPHHIAIKINLEESKVSVSQPELTNSYSFMNEEKINFSDLLLTMAKQLKLILLVPFITVFLSFTYIQFIKVPIYTSWATLILPDNKINSMGGLAGLASQFGVNVPTNTQADLSSPSLFPELLKSRIFAEKILAKEFYTQKFGEEKTLLDILIDSDDSKTLGNDVLVAKTVNSVHELIDFNLDPMTGFSTLMVRAIEPQFSKDLAETILAELVSLNRFFKSKNVVEKTKFIEIRIESVENDLRFSEQQLKNFNEKNRQISSPSLMLELDRKEREVEIQKGIFLTLKQQLELAKIEEIQETSIIQILDSPQVPLGPSNKKLVSTVFLAGFLGLVLGIILSFIRSYFNNEDMSERRKLRKIRNFLKKKGKDFVLDYKVTGTISFLLLMGLPFYLGHESSSPSYFGRYSANLLFLNIIYILGFILTSSLFIYSYRKKAKSLI